MLTKYDEFLCHQTVETFDSVQTSAREWTERIWFSVHDINGKYHLVAGIGVYPNRNIMDAYACITIDGKIQHNLRASRVLRPGSDDVSVGPLSYEIIDPMKKIRFTADDNEHGFTFDIEFEASFKPFEEETQYSKFRGRILENIKRYMQAGKPKGWINIDGEKIIVSRDSWMAERDHSWGIRRGGGVPESGVQPGEIPVGYLFNFIVVQFKDWSVTYHIRENWDGTANYFYGDIHYSDPGKEALPLSGIEHNFTFREDMRQINGGEVTINCSDGSSRTLSFKPKSICYLKGGGYFGFRGFTHGLWLGESYLDYVKADLNDADTIREISFLDDVHCEVSCDGETGHGIVEMVCIGKYPKYGYQGF